MSHRLQAVFDQSFNPQHHWHHVVPALPPWARLTERMTWKEKKKLFHSSFHLHTSCITTQLHLDYINVLSPSQASSACAKPILHPLRCLCRALWWRVILCYCVGINVKSHYSGGGSWKTEGARRGGVVFFHFKYKRRREIIAGLSTIRHCGILDVDS